MNENRPGTVNVWTARFVFIIGCVFCVEALVLRNKNQKWKGEEREREREREREKERKKERDDTFKNKGGGVKAVLNDFFAQEGK